MAREPPAGVVRGRAGGAAGARAARRQGRQRAGRRRGAGASRAAGARRQADSSAGGGRAVRRARGGAHCGRGRPPPRRLQDRPLHAHHARDTPPPRARSHQLDEHVAAILKKFNAKRHHHHQPPVHDREAEAVQKSGGVSEPVIARDASEPTDCPPRYLRIVNFNKYQYYYYIFLIREKKHSVI